MAKDDISRDQMNYVGLAQEAQRGIVRAALRRAASPQGLPGEHHFYISFRTTHPAVSIPADLLAKYPDEMTIVLQHRYRELAPGETFFSVILEFGGQPKALSIPYTAITRFFDPSVQFLLQFDPTAAVDEPPASLPKPEAKPKTASSEIVSEEPKIISLDQFRKK